MTDRCPSRSDEFSRLRKRTRPEPSEQEEHDDASDDGDGPAESRGGVEERREHERPQVRRNSSNFLRKAQFLSYFRRMIVIAHNIRSLHNVGSILRNAAAFGVEKVFLTGITGTPPRKEIAKVSLGAEDLVPWAAGEIGSVIDGLKTEGYAVWGLETGEGAVDFEDVRARGKGQRIALVLGSEVEGIDAETLKMLDGIVEIPMMKKRSLNVSVASGVAMYSMLVGRS